MTHTQNTKIVLYNYYTQKAHQERADVVAEIIRAIILAVRENLSARSRRPTA